MQSSTTLKVSCKITFPILGTQKCCMRNLSLGFESVSTQHFTSLVATPWYLRVSNRKINRFIEFEWLKIFCFAIAKALTYLNESCLQPTLILLNSCRNWWGVMFSVLAKSRGAGGGEPLIKVSTTDYVWMYISYNMAMWLSAYFGALIE